MKPLCNTARQRAAEAIVGPRYGFGLVFCYTKDGWFKNRLLSSALSKFFEHPGGQLVEGGVDDHGIVDGSVAA